MILVGLLSPSTHHLHRGLGEREKKGRGERGEEGEGKGGTESKGRERREVERSERVGKRKEGSEGKGGIKYTRIKTEKSEQEVNTRVRQTVL